MLSCYILFMGACACCIPSVLLCKDQKCALYYHYVAAILSAKILRVRYTPTPQVSLENLESEVSCSVCIPDSNIMLQHVVARSQLGYRTVLSYTHDGFAPRLTAFQCA